MSRSRFARAPSTVAGVGFLSFAASCAAVAPRDTPPSTQVRPGSAQVPSASGAPRVLPTLRFAAAHQLDTGVDGGGGFSVHRAYVEPGVFWRASDSASLGLSVGWARDEYRFRGTSGLAGLDPWDGVGQWRVGAFGRWALSDEWSLFGGPSVRTAVEDGADAGDGLQYGFLGGARYRVGPRLSIGPGLGVFTQLEDDPSVFPILVVDWRITDRLSLETGRGLGATRGPGLVLDWAIADDWSVALGGRYERLRFRLDDVGFAPGGIGEESSVPLYLAVARGFGFRSRAGLVGGVNLAGALRVDDAAGNLLARSDYGAAPFVGLFLEL